MTLETFIFLFTEGAGAEVLVTGTFQKKKETSDRGGKRSCFERSTPPRGDVPELPVAVDDH